MLIPRKEKTYSKTRTRKGVIWKIQSTKSNRPSQALKQETTEGRKDQPLRLRKPIRSKTVDNGRTKSSRRHSKKEVQKRTYPLRGKKARKGDRPNNVKEGRIMVKDKGGAISTLQKCERIRRRKQGGVPKGDS